jgi:hypothetical protein
LLPGQWVALFGLTRLHSIHRVIVCSLIINRNLAYGESTILDYCDMISTTSDYDMTIITLDMFYIMLSCWLTPNDALFVLHERCVGSGATCVLDRPHLHQEWVLKCFEPSSSLASGVRTTSTWEARTQAPVGTGPAPRTWHVVCPRHLTWQS